MTAASPTSPSPAAPASTAGEHVALDRRTARPGAHLPSLGSRGESLFCENFEAKGVAVAGGFAEYITYHQSKVYKINKLTDEEATLLEPAACAVHGIDKLRPKQGIEVLLFGAGPTGLILAQLLKINGARRVVIASNKGIKMDLAKQLGAADEYIELERGDGAKAQWAQIKKDNPYGFDVVAECTGVEKLIDDSINYVRRGGSLLVYGVYEDSALVHWPPGKIFLDEINVGGRSGERARGSMLTLTLFLLQIIGSFSHQFCMPRAVEYLESGKINVKGMVTNVFDLKDYQKALDCMNSRNALK